MTTFYLCHLNSKKNHDIIFQESDWKSYVNHNLKHISIQNLKSASVILILFLQVKH